MIYIKLDKGEITNWIFCGRLPIFREDFDVYLRTFGGGLMYGNIPGQIFTEVVSELFSAGII